MGLRQKERKNTVCKVIVSGEAWYIADMYLHLRKNIALIKAVDFLECLGVPNYHYEYEVDLIKEISFSDGCISFSYLEGYTNSVEHFLHVLTTYCNVKAFVVSRKSVTWYVKDDEEVKKLGNLIEY